MAKNKKQVKMLDKALEQAEPRKAFSCNYNLKGIEVDCNGKELLAKRSIKPTDNLNTK